jgi:hypothetical protein
MLAYDKGNFYLFFVSFPVDRHWLHSSDAL